MTKKPEADRPGGTHAAGSQTDVELDLRVQDILGRSLKAHFDDIIASPMPDRFLLLLAELEAKEQKLGKGDGNV